MCASSVNPEIDLFSFPKKNPTKVSLLVFPRFARRDFLSIRDKSQVPSITPLRRLHPLSKWRYYLDLLDSNWWASVTQRHILGNFLSVVVVKEIVGKYFSPNLIFPTPFFLVFRFPFLRTLCRRNSWS
jgi:hypothetical protein